MSEGSDDRASPCPRSGTLHGARLCRPDQSQQREDRKCAEHFSRHLNRRKPRKQSAESSVASVSSCCNFVRSARERDGREPCMFRNPAPAPGIFGTSRVRQSQKAKMRSGATPFSAAFPPKSIALSGRRVLVPEGTLRIARRFNAGKRVLRFVPEGRLNGALKGQKNVPESGNRQFWFPGLTLSCFPGLTLSCSGLPNRPIAR
ncbi:MAG: hypothetical protein ACI9VS_002820 [Candidatus Binatia bacterium]